MREEIESVRHKSAKETLRNWLAEGWDKDEYIEDLTIRVKHTGRQFEFSIRPDFIYCEYPFTSTTHAGLRDELDKGCFRCERYRSKEVYCPCLKCKKLQGNVICVADIALEHKGFVNTVFEVTHLNPPNKKKIEYLVKHGVYVIEVSADTISKLLTTRPPYLLVERTYP